jgi:hypothetical protein
MESLETRKVTAMDPTSFVGVSQTL